MKEVYGIWMDHSDFLHLKSALEFTFNHKCKDQELDEDTEVWIVKTLGRINDIEKILGKEKEN